MQHREALSQLWTMRECMALIWNKGRSGQGPSSHSLGLGCDVVVLILGIKRMTLPWSYPGDKDRPSQGPGRLGQGPSNLANQKGLGRPRLGLGR